MTLWYRCRRLARAFLAAVICASTRAALAAAQTAVVPDNRALAEEAANPLSGVAFTPVDIRANAGINPNDRTAYVITFEPRIPVPLTDRWRMVIRGVVPVVSQPLVTGDRAVGLANIMVTGFLGPVDSTGITWGVGPVALLPTTTTTQLEPRQPGIGVGGVGVASFPPYVTVLFLQNVWSFQGDINRFLAEPTFTYLLPDGWTAESGAEITADWPQPGGDRWTVGVGAGGGRTFTIGGQPFSTTVRLSVNVVKPTLGADWQLRWVMGLLFPAPIPPGPQ
ncbi:MAG TPA: hypothetical protein VFS33_01900 [Gemmatimonadales bacterium]|nr:hypothetical protein [Gemmatimonadales bacterium]